LFRFRRDNLIKQKHEAMSQFIDYFCARMEKNRSGRQRQEIHSCPELMDCIQQVGFLPLLESGIQGFSAEAAMAEECRFTQFDDGTWEWPLWQWKGPVVTEGNCVYGKFFAGKPGFISRAWWPDFYNWRRSKNPVPEDGGAGRSVSEAAGQRLGRENGRNAPAGRGEAPHPA
jgi:hypothetical protein